MQVRSFALPLAQGHEWADKTLGVQSHGRTCPTEQQVTGYHPDGSPAWLWVDVGLPDDWDEYVVAPVTSAASLKYAPLAVEDGTVVNTVAAEIDVADWIPYVLDADGVRHDGVCSYEVEEQTTLRAVIRADVVYGDPELCRATIWFHLSRGSTVVHVQHQWYCSQQQVALLEVGLDCLEGASIVIRDEELLHPARVDGQTALLWADGILDYQPGTLIDDGTWSEEFLAANIPWWANRRSITEEQMLERLRNTGQHGRYNWCSPQGRARTHWIACDVTGVEPTWAAIDPLPPDPTWWCEQQPAVWPMLEHGRDEDLDTLCQAQVNEADGAIRANVTDLASGWYYYGTPPLIRTIRCGPGETRMPNWYRSPKASTYFWHRWMASLYARGAPGAYDALRRRMGSLLDHCVSQAETPLPLRGVLAPVPGCYFNPPTTEPVPWMTYRSGATLRLRVEDQNSDPTHGLEQWLYLTRDYSARRNLELIRSAQVTRLRHDLGRMQSRGGDIRDWPHHYFETWLGTNARLICIAQLCPLTRVGSAEDRDEVRGYLDLLYSALYDETGEGWAHLRECWYSTDHPSMGLMYKPQVKLLSLIDIANTLDSDAARAAVVAGVLELCPEGWSYGGRTPGSYQPTHGAAMAWALRWATNEDDRERLRALLRTWCAQWTATAEDYADELPPMERWLQGGESNIRPDTTTMRPGFDPQTGGGYGVAPLVWRALREAW